MKKNYGFDTEFNKIKLIARSLWMGFGRGEGELEIDNQGRLDQSRFSQETEAIGQQTPRIGEDRPKLRLTTDTQVSARVSSAGRTLNSSSTPQFLSREQTVLQKLSEEKKQKSAEQIFSSPARQLKLPSQSEKAAKFLAEKTQKRLAALFRESEEE